MKEQLLTKAFFRRNPPREISSARFQHSILLSPDFENAVDHLMREKGMETDDMRHARALIQSESSPEALLRLMRRTLPGANRSVLIHKLLDMEDAVLPEIQNRILTSQIDVFIENALRFFVRAKADCSPWLRSHFDQIRSPYAQSTVCLALGFRAGPDITPWMMAQYESMKARFPSETLSEGPLLALYELHARFGMV